MNTSSLTNTFHTIEFAGQLPDLTEDFSTDNRRGIKQK